ncbi:MAG: helix-turn-helix domain-containing protein [Cytophagales bacterium]|nr:helix-turn-helix domain-containing protein [Cytophagales bacterium]
MEGRNGRDGQDQKSRVYRDQLLTVGDFNDLKNELIQEIKSLIKETTPTTGKKWLKSSEVRKLLGISTGTLQNLRINGSLSFSKVGGIIFYDYSEIVKLMERNGQG